MCGLGSHQTKEEASEEASPGRSANPCAYFITPYLLPVCRRRLEGATPMPNGRGATGTPTFAFPCVLGRRTGRNRLPCSVRAP